MKAEGRLSYLQELATALSAAEFSLNGPANIYA
jgi:hypothetical protein